jgi:adenine-specific DNA-methyltransferase
VTWEVPGIMEEGIERLRELYPQVFVEGEIDFEKLRTTLRGAIDKSPDRFTFSWAGRRDAVQILQMQTRATLVPSKAESLAYDSTRNLFLEGDNLEVMKLLYKPYFGRIRLAYIDPPYNTGNDFVYQDNYADPLESYLRISGQKSAEGNLLTSNPETSGRYHSAWLTMMYPRLFLARQLLREDGSIWISIDDTEEANLKQICNEIFGEENFVATFIWEKRTTRENRRVFSFNHDLVLCYARDKNLFQASRNLLPLSEEVLERYSNPDKDPRGDWQSVSLNAQAGHATPAQFYKIKTPSGRVLSPPPGRCWSVTEPRLQELIKDNRIWFGQDGDNVPRVKVFLSEADKGLTPQTLWTADEVGTNDSAKKALIDLFSGKSVYETPKPVQLMKRIITIATSPSEGDWIIDFFAGSCTTAHAVMEQNAEDGGNRRFMMIQLPEPTPKDSDARKAGFATIAEIGKERIRLAAKSVTSQHGSQLKVKETGFASDLGFKTFKLAESNHMQWKGVGERTPEKYAEEMKGHIDSLVKGWREENVICEVALKEGFGLDSKMELLKEYKENRVWRVKDSESDMSFQICLDEELNRSLLKRLDVDKESVFICRESAINDTSAANLALQCRLKTI